MLHIHYDPYSNEEMESGFRQLFLDFDRPTAKCKLRQNYENAVTSNSTFNYHFMWIALALATGAEPRTTKNYLEI